MFGRCDHNKIPCGEIDCRKRLYIITYNAFRISAFKFLVDFGPVVNKDHAKTKLPGKLSNLAANMSGAENVEFQFFKKGFKINFHVAAALHLQVFLKLEFFLKRFAAFESLFCFGNGLHFHRTTTNGSHDASIIENDHAGTFFSWC